MKLTEQKIPGWKPPEKMSVGRAMHRPGKELRKVREKARPRAQSPAQMLPAQKRSGWMLPEKKLLAQKTPGWTLPAWKFPVKGLPARAQSRHTSRSAPQRTPQKASQAK